MARVRVRVRVRVRAVIDRYAICNCRLYEASRPVSSFLRLNVTILIQSFTLNECVEAPRHRRLDQ